MGTAHEAIVSLGFIIPEPMLVALLQVLREHRLKDKAAATNAGDAEIGADTKSDEETRAKKTKPDENGGNSSTVQPSNAAKKIGKAAKLSEDDAQELLYLVEEATTRNGLHKYFAFTMRTTMRNMYDGMAVTYLGEYGDDSRGYCADTWGSYDVEPAFVELPDLNRNDVVEGTEFEEKIRLLRETLHFKEAMIEVEEKWILRVEVG